MRMRLLPLVAVLALLAAGCGEKESQGSGTAGGSAKDAKTASGGKTVQVKMKDILFVPEVVTARVGQTVRWKNEDSITHTVKAVHGATFASKAIGKGDTYEQKVTKPGRIAYVCTIHPNQKGTIEVVAP
jgi:plastocyanin